jgi:nucleotide-binding universal stress UspA family protein
MNESHQQTDVSLLRSLTRGIEPQKVLCWVNSNEKRDWVVNVAKALSASYQGICHAVMCLDCASRIRPRLPQTGSPVSQPLTPEVIGQAGQRLSALYGDDIHTMVLPGDPITEIRRYARTHQMDLIVMGEQALAVEQLYGERLLEDPPCMLMILAMPEQLHTKHPSKADGSATDER